MVSEEMQMQGKSEKRSRCENRNSNRFFIWKNKKPKPEQLAGIDIVVFDIQDVGVRFYTYISTLTYLMEAGAENNVEVMVLDRPNPHDGYTDGPVLRKNGQVL
jgi:uncharacterized protein YbbC (DUF1343 family)